MAEAKAQDVGKLSFEDALAELEQIVRGLEGGVRPDAGVKGGGDEG